MATLTKRKNKSGATSWVAQVRLANFNPVSKAFPTRKAAQEWADELEKELHKHREQQEVQPRITTLTVAELVRAFLSEPDTQALRSYSDLERILAWWVSKYGSERVRTLGAIKLREARDKLRPGRKPSTVNRYMAALRTCWNWGRAAKHVPEDKLWPPRLMMTENNERQRYLSDDELATLLRVARERSPVMYAAVLVSVATGVRQGELLRLKWTDVDLDGQRVQLLQTKTKTPRAVYLPESAVEALRELRRAPIVGQHVFLNRSGQPLRKGQLESEWRALRGAAGLQDFHWHDLRHSCASFLAQNGASLLEIGSVLGHTSPATTKRYAHLVQGKPVTGHDKLDDKLRGGAS